MTFAPLAALLLTLNPWPGVWRVQATDSTIPPLHFLVRPDLTIEVYQPNWAPLEIAFSQIRNGEMQVVQSNNHSVNYQVKLQSAWEFEGLATLRIGGGQGEATRRVTGIKAVAYAPSNSFEWIAASRSEDKGRIDILGLLVRQAPRQSFEEFRRFWERQVESRYYVYLHQALYGLTNDPQRRLSRLKSLFDTLPLYNPAELAELEKQAVAALDPRLSSRAETASCRVVLPSLTDAQARLETIAVARMKLADGRKACCGLKEITEEGFLLLPVPPSREAH